MKKLEDLEFYVMRWNFDGEPEVVNVFRSTRVLTSVALYKTGKYADYRKISSDLNNRTEIMEWAWWCFGDTAGRIQWEFGFGDPFKHADGTWDGDKMDVFHVFILPNVKLLKKMVDEVSVNSCRQWLRKENKRLGRYKRRSIDKSK